MTSNNKCQCLSLRSLATFHDWNDFDSFVSFLEKYEEMMEIPVGLNMPYLNIGFKERWFRCNQCQTVWRLVEPDPPFTGVWEQVS